MIVNDYGGGVELLYPVAIEVGTEVLLTVGCDHSTATCESRFGIRELRDLLEAWRDARRTAWQTTIKVVTTGILAALLVGAAIKLKLMGGVQ